MSDPQDTRARPETRARLVRAAEQLFRVQGYAGTGLKQLTAAAGAPWGSLYHFFPKGKAELAAAAAAHAGEIYAEGWRRAFDQADDPAEAVWRIFEGEVRVLEGSDYRNGCPIASMTLDVASLDEDLRRACDGAFGQWLAAMSQGFEAHGPAGRGRAPGPVRACGHRRGDRLGPRRQEPGGAQGHGRVRAGRHRARGRRLGLKALDVAGTRELRI
jgi:AcrR family transcriptional regulator